MLYFHTFSDIFIFFLGCHWYKRNSLLYPSIFTVFKQSKNVPKCCVWEERTGRCNKRADCCLKDMNHQKNFEKVKLLPLPHVRGLIWNVNKKLKKEKNLFGEWCWGLLYVLVVPTFSIFTFYSGELQLKAEENRRVTDGHRGIPSEVVFVLYMFNIKKHFLMQHL